MALVSSAASPKPRRPTAFTVRSFPTRCGPSAVSSPTNGRNPSIADGTSSLGSTSCGTVASLGENVLKQPIVFAIRSFPKGCGPHSSALLQTLDSKQASSEFSNGNLNDKRAENLPSEEISGLSKKGGLSTVRTLPDGCRPNGFGAKVEVNKESNKNVGQVSKGGKDVVSQTNEVGDKIKLVDHTKDVSKRGRVSTVRNFPNDCKTDVSEVNIEAEMKKSCLDIAREVHKEGHKLGKTQEKGTEKSNGGDHPMEVRGDRLIVQALMAAPCCLWRQGKRKASSIVQPKEKKPGVKEKGNP